MKIFNKHRHLISFEEFKNFIENFDLRIDVKELYSICKTFLNNYYRLGKELHFDLKINNQEYRVWFVMYGINKTISGFQNSFEIQNRETGEDLNIIYFFSNYPYDMFYMILYLLIYTFDENNKEIIKEKIKFHNSRILKSKKNDDLWKVRNI